MVENRSVLDSDPEELIFHDIFISSNHIVIEGNISLLRIYDQYLKEPDLASWVRKILQNNNFSFSFIFRFLKHVLFTCSLLELLDFC